MKKQIILGILLALICACAVIGVVLSSHQGPKLGGDFTLNSENGRWNFAENKKPLNLLYVGYAKCPDVCPMALSHSSAAFKGLSPEQLLRVQLIFISVDAAHDTPESVTTYAKQFYPSFVGLTGTPEQIDAAIKPFGASYMIEEKKDSYLGYSIAHTDRLYFLDKKGSVIDMIASPRSSEEILLKIKEHL